MAVKDYIPISKELSSFLGKLLNKYRPPQQRYALAGEGYVFMAPEEGCTGCQGTCSGTCSANCANNCSGTCKSGCSGSCKSGCKGGCTGTCSGTCSNTCSGTCASTCSTSCVGNCANTCENYCQICQTFCEYQETFSKNNGANKGTGMGKSFAWNRTYASGDKIIIEAEKWDELAEYINNAQVYCSSTSIDVKDDVVVGDLITAAIWNNLNDGLNNLKNANRVSSVTKDVDKIKADEVNSLADEYNAAKIKTGLPSNSSGAKDLCCQNGMTPESDWGRNQVCPQTCTQTPRCNKNE